MKYRERKRKWVESDGWGVYWTGWEYSTVPEVLAHGPCGPTVFNQSQLTLRFLREVIG
jgi:hypothetical protein